MASWSSRRKLAYGSTVILGLVAIIGIPAFLVFYKAPTCFDRVMNGKESGVDCGGSCAYSTAGDYIRFGQMLLNGGSLEGKRVLGPQTVAFMTSNHLNKDIKNNVSGTEPARVGYGFGLGVAVRTERGLSANNGNVGDYSWNGAYGTIFFVDPKEQMVVVMMGVAPGEIRKIHREKLNALIYGALEK